MDEKHNCFCAFCKTPRRVPKTKHVGLVHIVLAAGLSFFSIYFTNGSVEGKMLLFFVCLLGLIEVTVQMRWRLAITCQKCGFDPVLYVRSREKAAEKVKMHMQAVEEGPLGLLRMGKTPEKETNQQIDKQPQPMQLEENSSELNDESEVGRSLSGEV